MAVVWRFVAAAVCVTGVTAEAGQWSKNTKELLQMLGKYDFEIPMLAARGSDVPVWLKAEVSKTSQEKDLWCSDVHRVCSFSFETKATAEGRVTDFGAFNEDWSEARATIRDEVKKTLDLWSGEDWCVDVPGGFMNKGPVCRPPPGFPEDAIPETGDGKCHKSTEWRTTVQVRDPTQCNGLTRGEIAAIAVGAAVVVIAGTLLVLYFFTNFLSCGGSSKDEPTS